MTSTAKHADIRSLRAFVILAEELHFGRAAERLSLSQPSLTQQIQQLEKRIGGPLFTRNNRHVLLTDHGTRLLDDARALVARVDAFLHAALQADDKVQHGQLHIGYQALSLVSTARTLYLRIVRNCLGMVPILHEMDTTQQVAALRKGMLDLGIIARPTGETTLRLHRVLAEEFMIALADDHPLTHHKRIPVKALINVPLALPTRHTSPGLHDAIIATCSTAGFSPTILHETQNVWNAASLAGTGLAAAIVPQSIAAVPLPGVVYRPFRGAAPMAELFAAWLPGNRSKALGRALEQLPPAV